MKKGIKVSVVVPVHDAMDYLANTVEYIGRQSLCDIEIIYVDDGSVDGSADFLDTVSSKDKRVTVIRQQNLYAGAARNNGLKNASGEYVVFWDSDDIFRSDALEKMYDVCRKSGADICLCGAYYYDDIDHTKTYASTYMKTKYLPENRIFGHEDIDKYIYNFSTNVPWNKMFRRQFLEEHELSFQTIQRANDNYFSMMAMFYARTFAVVNEPLIGYRINYRKSLIGSVSDTPLCVYEAYSRTYEELKDQDGFESVRQSFLNKTLRSWFYFLDRQTSFESYKTLYYKYQNDVLPSWGFPDDEEFYYSNEDYERFISAKNLDAGDFLLEECRRINRIRQQNKNSDVRIKNKELKEKNKELNRKIKNLNGEIEKLKNR